MSCDSHYISRFTTFFIDARAKRSFVESFDSNVIQTSRPIHASRRRGSAEARVASTGLSRHGAQRRLSVMIPPQVHLRRPCYDFYILEMYKFAPLHACDGPLTP